MRKEYGRSFEPCAGSQRHATAVASASGTAAIGEVVCIGVLCDFAFGPLRRLRAPRTSKPSLASAQRQSSAYSCTTCQARSHSPASSIVLGWCRLTTVVTRLEISGQRTADPSHHLILFGLWLCLCGFGQLCQGKCRHLGLLYGRLGPDDCIRSGT